MRPTGARKRVALGLLIALAVTLLAACGGQPAANQKTGEGGQQQVDQKQNQADANAAQNIQRKDRDAK